MKKLIAAAAGLMLVGTMVGSAAAAVTFGGDARVRWYYEENGNGLDQKDEKFSSRVRVKVNADAKGGAYARARIRMADSTWDGTRQTRNRGAGSNSYVDYAYIGVPMGPVTFEGGLMPVNLTKFTLWDARADQFILKWANDMTNLEFWFQKNLEVESRPADPTFNDLADDNDINTYFLKWDQKFAGDWMTTVGLAYRQDETPADVEGAQFTVHFSGPAGPVALAGELAYVESDLLGAGASTAGGAVTAADDAWGGYLQGGMNFGATSATISGGFTQDGYLADDDFGYIMIGGASSITPAVASQIGLYGDWGWIAGDIGFKVSEQLSLRGVLAYADISDYGDLFEVSGSVKYAISDGASFTWDIGYLNNNADADVGDENPFGTALTFGISY
ncbi:MAG: hypothetical protein HKP41_07770 [Desulfobacterales bacterium]|nr:hypothetical protein [Deltaproteobacteria bacterium]NNK94232.1 hypothetical protein [Desulfobacterales bacterium]